MLTSYAKERRLKIPSIDFIIRASPNVLHAYVSADFVRRNKWITNRSDLNAIRAHTLGSLTMGVPEKILYVADLAAPDRIFREAEAVRRIAKKDLNKGFVEALRVKIMYQLRRNKMIHPLVVQVWNKYGI